MCRGLATIADFRLPDNPRTTVNIGIIQAGASVGAIGALASAQIDMRSLDTTQLELLDANVVSALEKGIVQEERFRGRFGEISLERISLGDIPASRTDINNPLIQAACLATEAIGEKYDIGPESAGCNHGCIAAHIGIPAVCLGYGGVNGNNHALDENFDPTNAYKATQKLLLTTLAMAGLSGVTKPLAAIGSL
jgi:acetylornithine deacetylase/succinyl-diaminopimelate desuccinylase-like protein